MKSFETLVGKTTRAAIADDRQIKQVISRIVPAGTLTHIEFCRIEDGRVRITVDSAAWVSRIRFLESQIIDALRKRKFDSHSISYHVSPETRSIAQKKERQSAREKEGTNALPTTETAPPIVGKNWESNDRFRQELLKLARALRADDS